MGFIKKFATEFKEFALKGSVVDMAIGGIIGAAFKDIVTSFTSNFISPLINSIGGANIAGSIRLPWVDYSNMALEDVQKLSLNYGAFISAIINFLIMALILFAMLKGINALKGLGKKKKKEEAPAPPPEPSDEVKLLTEIKDLLKEKK
jgi:large conductance mechanosensitive channel